MDNLGQNPQECANNILDRIRKNAFQEYFFIRMNYQGLQFIRYREENVWHLCNDIGSKQKSSLEEFFVVFISNLAKTVPLWCQKSAKDPSELVIWDYHVVLVSSKEKNSPSLTYDLDSTLTFPCSTKEYIQKAIGSDEELLPDFHRMFRVIGATDYLEHFSSDRSHMLKDDGSWNSPPPNYDCIKTGKYTMNLQKYISMEHSPEKIYGCVYTLAKFKEIFL